MKKFSFPIKTRYVETAQDQIIHHSSYIVYYETARIEYLASKGVDISAMERAGILCPVVSLDAHYLKPLRSLENIEVRVSIDFVSKVRFKILHEIFKESEKYAFAITTHCFINTDFKPVAIPKDLYISFESELKSRETEDKLK